MKFCYLDESGTGDEPFAVMVGVIVDAQRMHLTKQHWDELLTGLSAIAGRPLTELHTRHFYAGTKKWRGVEGPVRARIITAIFKWLRDRKHHLVYTAVDKGKFNREFANEPAASDIKTLWRFMALHICLAIQKHFQGFEKNKGNTLLIFDKKERDASHFTQLIKSPPAWTDTYYNRKSKQSRLDQIVDVPYFGDSQDVGLIQVADFVSYFIRRYIEVHEEAIPSRYDEEEERLQGWMDIVFSRSIKKSAIYPARGRCDCANLFYRYAPACVL